jgi:ABC-type phosphate transport system substrate-binding protein
MAVNANFFASFIILLFTLGTAQAESSNSLNNNAFSDPDVGANVGDDFESIAIQYEKKVGDVDVVISLGQQTYPALHKVVADIAREQGIKVAIQQGSCGSTAKKLLKKSADIGTYGCPPGKTDRLPGLNFHTLAIAPIALTTNPANSLDDVSIDDARKIFRGDYVSWSEVPGLQDSTDQLTRKKIQPVVRLHCKKRYGHWRALLDNQDQFSPRIQSVATIKDMIKQVGANKTAIGYETPFMIKIHKDKGLLKILSIDGNHPDNLDKLLSAEYPLYRTYSMTTWAGKNNKNEKAEELLSAIKEHIEEKGGDYGFIPASQLRLAGWKFRDEELIGEPDGAPVISERN